MSFRTDHVKLTMGWVQSFRRRHSKELSLRTIQTLEPVRAKAVTRKSLKKYFRFITDNMDKVLELQGTGTFFHPSQFGT